MGCGLLTLTINSLFGTSHKSESAVMAAWYNEIDPYGAIGLPAAGAGAPHIRQRLWFVADAAGERRERLGQARRRNPETDGRGTPGGLGHAGPTDGHWASADWLLCRDGRWRPVEPGACPLVDGAAGCVERLRAYGNAIVPQVAAEVIRAYVAYQTEQMR